MTDSHDTTSLPGHWADPVFAAIKAHHEARMRWLPAIAEDEERETSEAEDHARLRLFDLTPVTLAGLAAYGRYVVNIEAPLRGDDDPILRPISSMVRSIEAMEPTARAAVEAIDAMEAAAQGLIADIMGGASS